ncbi:DNA glycosylase [Hypoxylon sp. NC1633]|nr:DNA glycosylase [Hypoxylon sp. NC1633]
MARHSRKTQPLGKAPVVPVGDGQGTLPHALGWMPDTAVYKAPPTTELPSAPNTPSTGRQQLVAEEPSIAGPSPGTEVHSADSAASAVSSTTPGGSASGTVQESTAAAQLTPDISPNDFAVPQSIGYQGIVKLKTEKSTQTDNNLIPQGGRQPELADPETNGVQQTRRQLRPRKPQQPVVVTVDEPSDNRVPKKRKRKADEELDAEPKPKRGKKTDDNPYGLTPGQSPFPTWTAPSPEQCEEVYDVLRKAHGAELAIPPENIPDPSLKVTGCGEVPSVLDALLRTHLSSATTFKSAAVMLNGLVERFGILDEGIGKGSINWYNVRSSSLDDVHNAIRSGGLGGSKAANIKAILDKVYLENIERREAQPEERNTNEQANVTTPTEEMGERGALKATAVDHELLSLQHLHGLTVNEAMRRLTIYRGIGVKTSACVILFCLRKPCFAVDTHVYKLSQWLKWVPKKANEIDTFSHLEVRCPDRLKYGLHQMMIRHGQECRKCQRSTVVGTAEWETLPPCPLEGLLDRFDKRQSKTKEVSPA